MCVACITRYNDLVCRQKLLLQHRTPTLLHHGNIWIFHFLTRHQISLRCPDTRDQIHRTITLYGTGILHNTSECHITSDEITIFPDLHGTSLAELDLPKFYLPDNISIVTNDEIQQLKDNLLQIFKDYTTCITRLQPFSRHLTLTHFCTFTEQQCSISKTLIGS